MTKRKNKAIIGIAGGVLLATAVALVIYKINKEEEEDDYFTSRYKGIRQNFGGLTHDVRQRRLRKNLTPNQPYPAEDEFGIFL